jgi:uncharacterized membrane protein YjgN (DUF898 family)
MTVANPGQQQSASSQAITAFVLSILGIVCCGLLAPISWYLANQELQAIREGRSPVAGEGLVKVASILGIVGTVLLVLGFIIGLIWLFLLGGMAVLSGMSGAMGS